MNPLPPHTDPRTGARLALARVVRDPAWWPTTSLVILRNRLLDELGSDHRPLVQLLVRAAELDVPARLMEAPADPMAWRALRSALVVGMVSDGFLQPEAAQWAVEAWAWALGAIGTDQLTAAPPPVITAAVAAPPATTARPPAAAASPPTPGAPGAPPTPPVAGARPVPPLAPRRPVPAPPRMLGYITAVSLSVIVGGMGWLVWQAIRNPAAAAPAPLPRALPAPASAPATDTVAIADTPSGAAVNAQGAPLGLAPGREAGIPGITGAALPASREDSLRMLWVRPNRRAGAPGFEMTRVPPVAIQQAVGTPGMDQLVLRDGTTLIGRVEVIRTGAIQFRDAATGLRFEFAKDSVREVISEFGTVVRFGAVEPPVDPALRARLAQGVGGVYRVAFRLDQVRGSRACDALWKAPPAADRATVWHVPGADTLSIQFERGARFLAVMDRAGYFNTTFVIVPDQAFAASAVTTRLSGRFTPRGFDAQVNLIGYRKQRGAEDIVCHSVIDAIGEVVGR